MIETTTIKSDGLYRPTIMQVLPALHSGGVERGTVDLAGALVEAGVRSIVVSSGGPMVREITRIGAEHVMMPVHAKGWFAMRRNAQRLAQMIVAEHVDLIHARSRAPAWSALWAARRTGIKFVTTVHGAYGAQNRLKRAYNAVMLRGDRVIAISDFIAEYIRTTYQQADMRRVCVIPRGVDLRIFDPECTAAARVVDLATRWRLPDGMPIIMLAGRLSSIKGQDVLIEALAKIDRPDVRCLLIGSDQGKRGFRTRLEAQVRALKRDAQVHIIDDCRDMAAAYMLADVVVSASVVPEGFGRSIAEAQAMGKPVIATDHGAAKEIILPGETGWLVPPRDADAMARALKTALNLSTATREALAQKAIARIHQHFSRDLMCDRTIKIYAALIGKKWRGCGHLG